MFSIFEGYKRKTSLYIGFSKKLKFFNNSKIFKGSQTKKRTEQYKETCETSKYYYK